MNYKVIGWTCYDNPEILCKYDNYSRAEVNAIVDDIKEHRYLFSGYHHQESYDHGVVPVLNDGRERVFSMRGWGKIMATAYGKRGEYAYAQYMTYHDIDEKKLRFPEMTEEVSEVEGLTAEDYEIDVNEGVFERAKTSNPFYIEDLPELRYMDNNDSITLCHNGEKQKFIVKEVLRSKTSKKEKEFIEGKWKLSVKHKPESEREYPQKPTYISKSGAWEEFERAIRVGDIAAAKEALEDCGFSDVPERLTAEKDKLSENFRTLIRTYLDDMLDTSTLIFMLNWLDDFELYKEIASDSFDRRPWIYVGFLRRYLNGERNIDEYIVKFANEIDPNQYYYNNDVPYDILIKAVELRPTDKLLAAKCYSIMKFSPDCDGFPIMLATGAHNLVDPEDRRLLEPKKYLTYSMYDVKRIVEYMTYPNDFITSGKYPFNTPVIYFSDARIISDGIMRYQGLMRERYDIDSFLGDMLVFLLDGLFKLSDASVNRALRMAIFVFELDVITNHEYNLKERAIAKYSDKIVGFKEELEKLYEEE